MAKRSVHLRWPPSRVTLYSLCQSLLRVFIWRKKGTGLGRHIRDHRIQDVYTRSHLPRFCFLRCPPALCCRMTSLCHRLRCPVRYGGHIKPVNYDWELESYKSSHTSIDTQTRKSTCDFEVSTMLSDCGLTLRWLQDMLSDCGLILRRLQDKGQLARTMFLLKRRADLLEQLARLDAGWWAIGQIDVFSCLLCRITGSIIWAAQSSKSSSPLPGSSCRVDKVNYKFSGTWPA